jgi:hypothetical protein
MWACTEARIAHALRAPALILAGALLCAAPVYPRHHAGSEAEPDRGDGGRSTMVAARESSGRDEGRRDRSPARCSPHPQFLHSFEDSIDEHGAYSVQRAAPDRIALIDAPVRHGARAIRFRTSGLDTRINGSGTWERSELRMDTRLSDGVEGAEQWWAHSTYFPDDFQFPQRFQPWQASLFVQWHDSRDAGRQPNLVGEIVYEAGRNPGLVMRFRVTHEVGDYRRYAFFRGPPQKNLWYDFVYHLKWSSGSQGFAQIWVRREDELRGHLVMDYHGPTLYPDNGVYFKIGTYHPLFPDPPGSVIHDCVAKGRTVDEIRWFPLEGLE